MAARTVWVGNAPQQIPHYYGTFAEIIAIPGPNGAVGHPTDSQEELEYENGAWRTLGSVSKMPGSPSKPFTSTAERDAYYAVTLPPYVGYLVCTSDPLGTIWWSWKGGSNTAWRIADATVRDRFFMSISFGSGSGTNQNLAIGSTSFTKIAFTSAGEYSGQLVDPSSLFDTANNWYVVPYAGSYKVTVKSRLIDTGSSGAAPAGTSYGIGADTSVQDSPAFLWGVTNPVRNGMQVTRVMSCNAGDHIQAIARSLSAGYFSNFTMTVECISVG